MSDHKIGGFASGRWTGQAAIPDVFARETGADSLFTSLIRNLRTCQCATLVFPGDGVDRRSKENHHAKFKQGPKESGR